MNIDYTALQKQLDALTIKKQPKTFLQILDKSYNEVLISKYLACFLNEENTCRDVIKQLLTKTQLQSDVNFIDLLNYATFETVSIEESISRESRLDIIVKYSNFWIVIENKIFAYESKNNQTYDYEQQIQKQNINNLPIKFIYLKPSYNKSKPSNPNFVVTLYDDLFNIFASLKTTDLNDKDCYFYLQDFITHTKEFLMKDNLFIDNPEMDFYLKNKSKLDYIINKYKQQSKNIRDLLVESLKDTFKSFQIYASTTDFIQVFKDNWENINHTGIHFELLINTNWDSILSKEPVIVNFVIHNEKNTRDKYTDIKTQKLFTKKLMFDNQTNIQNSIQTILDTIQLMIDKYSKFIDDIISKK